MLRSALLALAVAVSAACAGATTSAPAAATPPAPAPAPGEGALAPFPYTAEQIRDASPLGRVFRHRIVENGAVNIAETRFVAVDATTATFETIVSDEAGKQLAPPQRATATWDELRHHASYPAAATTVEDAAIDTPAGHFECMKYVVRRPHEDGRPSVTIAYFAKQLPGPPVRMIVEAGGAIIGELTLIGQ